MEQKIKLIIIGLIALLGFSVFVNFQTLTSKQAIERERDQLSKENGALEDRYNKISRDYNVLETKVASLNEDFSRIQKERDELQVKYDLVEKSRQDLIERLKAEKSKPAAAAQAPETVSAPPADSYWAGILRDKATLETQIDNIRTELRSLQEKNEQLQREKINLDVELRNVKLEKQDLKRQLEFAQKQIIYNQKAVESFTLELVGEKNDKLQIADTLKAVKSENHLLRQQLKVLTSRKQNLERKIDELKQENEKYTKRFNEMDILVKDKMIQIDMLKKQAAVGKSGMEGSGIDQKSSVELPPIIVRPENYNSVSGTHSPAGRVLAVNKENNFVVIDMGEESGIKPGDSFKIVRDNEEIAVIEVIQVRKSISACDIKKEASPIKVGDLLK